MGGYFRKGLDEFILRLVSSWQLSQPLHLRHLSIVRDTTLKGKSQSYIYYTYENFNKLVEGGTGFWEAVKTVASGVTIGKNVAAALDAKPDVDEYGFPRLEDTQFQGRQNNATLEECVSALRVDPVHVSATDPILSIQADGSHGKQPGHRLRFVSINHCLGIRYKRHQQHPVTIDNGSKPEKAASKRSQAASIEARAIEPKKVALSTPSGAVLTQTKAIEPKKVAVSKSSHIEPAKGRAIGFQTQRRKSVRNPDSKPPGRPRKYPKTGIPANFDIMTPDEVDLLLQSQEMFEKYELIKIEKEIIRRIEDGEDAVVVAYEVLAEKDNSRKQEGELPLPKTSRAQVLHAFAGEPMPELNPAEAKPKGRHRKDTRYRPSMAAHTHFIPALREQVPPESKSKDPGKETSILSTRTRRRGQRVSDLVSMIYLPSIAAHSWPYVRPPSSAKEISITTALQNNFKRKQRRSSKPKQLSDSPSRDLPSIAAHSGSFKPPDTLSRVRVGQKRKRTASVPLENHEEHEIPVQFKYWPSIAAHSGSFLPPNALQIVRAGQKRGQCAHMLLQHDEHHATPSTSPAATQTLGAVPAGEALLGTSKMQPNTGNEGMYPGWKKFMSKYYQQQLETITRSNTGVFIGKTAPRRKRLGEPRDFRPAHFKLAVLKSTRLNELNWFVKSAASEHMSGPESRTQTPTSQVAEPASISHTQSKSEGQPLLSNSTGLPSPASRSVGSQPISTYISPYADIAGTKRKRTSPQPRGAAPFNPFSTSPCSRYSSPIADSCKPISDSSSPLEIAALSPNTDKLHGKSILELEAPTRTPEKQPDTNELSRLTLNPPVLNDLESMQGEGVTSQIVQLSQLPTQEASNPSNRQSISKLSRRGGSTSMLRKTIIMDIVNKCKGVFPSHREMCPPFAAEWKRRGQQGAPEPKTISNAVDALIKENKLRQITFASRTRQGMIVTKNMLTLPTIDTTDPRVREIQTNMVAYHPRRFVPMAVLPPQDYQSAETRDNKINGEGASAKTTEETVQASSAPEPAELRRLDIAKKITYGKNRAAMARLQALNEQGPQGLGHADGDEPNTEFFIQRATTDMVHAAPGTGKEVMPKPTPKRLSGRRGQKPVERLASIKRRGPSRITPLPPIPANPVSDSKSLEWLPSGYAFSDFNFEEQRPTVLMAAAENDVQTGISEALIPLDFNDEARQRIRNMAENAARIERKQALANSTRPPLLHTDFNHGQSEHSYPPIRSPSPPRQALHERVLLLSFMDPVHDLHRATGTFSVTFSGLEPPRKIFAHRDTTLDSNSASLKAVNSHGKRRRSARSPLLQELQETEKTPFDEEVDGLLRRELEANESNDVVLVGWPFINHVFSHAHKTVEVVEADMEAVKQVNVRSTDGRLTYRQFPRNKTPRPSIGNSIFSTGSRGIDTLAVGNRTQLKRRRLTSLMEIRSQDEASKQVELDQDHRRTKLRRIYGPREAKSLGENGEERLLTAVTVIRALTGGLDKRIDWVLVAKVFEPTYTQMFVHSRWGLTLQKYKLVLPKLESDFQSIFASAYEEGTVPAMDYDNLEDYDWKWLVEWTMANLNSPTQSLPELPVERSKFDSLYKLNETSNNEINEYYEIDGSSALARRTKIVHRDPYVLPLVRKRQGARPEDAADLGIAKSWIRANIMTPESTYNPSVARAKLLVFPDRTVEDALKQLLFDRVLIQENRGRLIPGRNYDISDFLISRLKKNLHAAHFHRAAAYKQQLDQDFVDKGVANYSDAADDGDMIVIFNLQAHHRITIVPIGVPMNKWGQTDGGYETRQMDKRRLNFSLELRPSPTYIYGNPLPPLPAPPSQHLQDTMAKIPLWYDIHGSLVPVMWEMVLAAVLAVLAVRPGVGASELEKTMRPAMERWELQKVLEWLVDAKAAKRVGQGFSVEDEWWWLAMGAGERSEQISGEDVGDQKGRGNRKGKESTGDDVQDMITMGLD